MCLIKSFVNMRDTDAALNVEVFVFTQNTDTGKLVTALLHNRFLSGSTLKVACVLVSNFIITSLWFLKEDKAHSSQT